MARRELAKHAHLVAEIKAREAATLAALRAFDGAAAPSQMGCGLRPGVGCRCPLLGSLASLGS